MKKIIFFFIVFICSVNILFSSEKGNKLILLEDNTVHYIYEKRVNIRSEASLKSDIVGSAVLGDKVKIIKRTELSEELYGLSAYWYKIEWSGKIGYIWGGLLSTQEVIADFDRDGKNEYLLNQCISKYETYVGEYMAEYDLNFKLCRRGQLISDSPMIAKVLESSKLNVLKNNGFSPEIPIVKITFAFGDGPGYVQNDQLYYLKDNKFRLICQYSSSGFMSDSEKSIVTFPKDGSKKNTLNIKTHVIKYKYDEESDMGEEKIEDYISNDDSYYWDGKSFRKIKK